MNLPGKEAMLKHSVSVSGQIELLVENVRCEQRVRVTNGSVFIHDSGENQHHSLRPQASLDKRVSTRLGHITAT